jgi:Asp-tRNA(Asn)/Glu-tRNA(Gln) amidotransferase A subunit family amidase
MLFAPAVTMPLMAVQNMPLGAQVMGQPHEDARATAMARWLVENLVPSVAA